MTQEIEQKFYTLQSAPWLDKTGFEKGRQHDRQPLGFILPANTPLTFANRISATATRFCACFAMIPR